MTKRSPDHGTGITRYIIIIKTSINIIDFYIIKTDISFLFYFININKL